jgi:thioredoxin reductase
MLAAMTTSSSSQEPSAAVDEDVPVLIVGGGGAGLTASMLLACQGLSLPGGFAAGPNGAIYVSNWSILPANTGGGPTGQVVRITP